MNAMHTYPQLHHIDDNCEADKVAHPHTFIVIYMVNIINYYYIINYDDIVIYTYIIEVHYAGLD